MRLVLAPTRLSFAGGWRGVQHFGDVERAAVDARAVGIERLALHPKPHVRQALPQ